jgi:hypothetical protein
MQTRRWTWGVSMRRLAGLLMLRRGSDALAQQSRASECVCVAQQLLPRGSAAYDGLELRVRGDGLRYKLILRCSAGWDTAGYTASFNTTPGVVWHVCAVSCCAGGCMCCVLLQRTTLPLCTSVAGWQTVRVRFQDMKPVFRARTMRNMPPLNPATIYSLQLMLR